MGELVIRGSNVMRGYWEKPEETAKRLKPGPFAGRDGAVLRRHLFRTDAEGWLYFVARKDDIIKSRGEKVSPREVENVHPRACDGVYGSGRRSACPIEVLGEAVKAFVTLKKPEATLTERDVIKPLRLAQAWRASWRPSTSSSSATSPRPTPARSRRPAWLEAWPCAVSEFNASHWDRFHHGRQHQDHRSRSSSKTTSSWDRQRPQVHLMDADSFMETPHRRLHRFPRAGDLPGGDLRLCQVGRRRHGAREPRQPGQYRRLCDAASSCRPDRRLPEPRKRPA